MTKRQVERTLRKRLAAYGLNKRLSYSVSAIKGGFVCSLYDSCGLGFTGTPDETMKVLYGFSWGFPCGYYKAKSDAVKVLSELG